MVDFSSRLKKLRIQNNITQEQLAKRIGLTKSVISAYETGIRMPSYEALLAISRVFKVSIDYLLGNENSNIDTVDLSGLTVDEKQSVKNLIKTMKNK